jgi:DNA gyrase inhibitor GyrI
MQSHPRRSTRSPLAAGLASLLGVSIIGVAACIGATEAGGVAGVTGGPSGGPALVSTSAVAKATAWPTPRAIPAPTPSPTPAPTPSPTLAPSPTPTTEPVLAMNLYRKGDFVSQATKDQCVSAAMQIMLNIVGPTDDRSKATQARIDALATDLSGARPGATEPLGWARGLEELGGGRYAVVVAPTRGKAIERAVRAIRATGRPAGLLVWRGAHSWVLHGYQSTVDPASTETMTVTHLYVSDPWYPRISSIWGPSRGPNARITPKQLEEDFLQWRRPTGRYPGMDGQYVLILPVDG